MLSHIWKILKYVRKIKDHEKTVILELYIHQTVFLFLYNSWIKICVHEMQMFQKYFTYYHDSLKLLGIGITYW